MQLDLNSQQCIKDISNFGETVYQNICNGTETVVPWGTMDYVGIGLLGFFVLFVATLFSSLLYISISSEMRWRKRYS